jgi:hypothetical protein
VEAATSRSHHPQNPPLNLGYLALMRFKLWAKELFETAITIRQPQPFGGRKGVLLVGRSSYGWEGLAPQRKIDLCDSGAIGRHAPSVERPEMNSVLSVLPESFNGRMREECLNVSWFGNLFEARERIAMWRQEYNEERPHSSLGYRTPKEFAREVGGEKGCGKGAAWKSKSNFSTPLGNPANGAGFPLSHSPGGDGPFTREVASKPDVVL